MTAPTILSGHTKGADGGNTTTTTVTVPSTNAAGDVVFIALADDSNAQTMSSVNFTARYANLPIQTSATFALLNKLLTGVDSGSYSVSKGVAERAAWLSFVVRGANGPVIHATSTVTGGSGSGASFSSLTTTVDECLVIRIVATDQITTPFGEFDNFTKLDEISGTSAGSVGVYWMVQDVEGIVPGDSVSLNVSEQWLGVTFAMASASLSPKGAIAGRRRGWRGNR